MQTGTTPAQQGGCFCPTGTVPAGAAGEAHWGWGGECSAMFCGKTPSTFPPHRLPPSPPFPPPPPPLRPEGGRDGAFLPEAARGAMAALVRAVVSGNSGGRHRRLPPLLTRRPPPRPSPRHGGALRGLSGPCGPSAVLRPYRSGAARLAALTRGEEGAGWGWGGFLWVCASIGAVWGFGILGLGFIFEDLLLFFSSEGSPFWRSLSPFRGVIKVPISVSGGGDWVPVNESGLLISSFVSHPCVCFWSVGF